MCEEEKGCTPKRKKEAKGNNLKMSSTGLYPIECDEDLVRSMRSLRQYENSEEALYVWYDDQTVCEDAVFGKVFGGSIENVYKFPNCVEKIRGCSVFEQMSWYLEKKE